MRTNARLVLLGKRMFSLKSVRRSVRGLGKTCVRTIDSMRWERRLGGEIKLLRDSANVALPDFLILGAPKCGTSWLQGALRQHPRVQIVPDEIEYFSSHIDRPLAWYLAHFEGVDSQRDVAPDQRFVLGEKSAGYCAISISRIKLVKQLLPEARLILMVRDPVARHWSHAKRYFSKEKSQKKGYDSLESRQKLYEFFARTRRLGEFARAIENWTRIYPPERLLVISQEAAIADPELAFRKALQHINLPYDQTPTVMKQVMRQGKNAGPKVSMPDDVKRHLEQMYVEERKRLAGVLETFGA